MQYIPNQPSMQPMLPEETRELIDLACEVLQNAATLKGSVHQPQLLQTLAELVREMNCYYSNLIEDHHTHPIDIRRALNKDIPKTEANPQKRNLQLEARAHIMVQRTIDEKSAPPDLVSERYICWIHRAFCKRLPDELLWVENPKTGERIQVVPGKPRDGDVRIGRHLPPDHEAIPDYIRQLGEAYDLSRLSKPQQVIASACLHHRFLWVHPFYDGNGRVARLLTHAYMQSIGIGNPLWSVSRGLARQKEAYKQMLQQADNLRAGDLDGRGNLSNRALTEFCAFFLHTCIDQIEFMTGLLEPKTLLSRIRSYARKEIELGKLMPQSDRLLECAVLEGEFARGRAEEITGYKAAQASKVLNQLVKQGLLTSTSPKGPVRLGIPIEVLEIWFPQLYPSRMKETGLQTT